MSDYEAFPVHTVFRDKLLAELALKTITPEDIAIKQALELGKATFNGLEITVEEQI